LAVLLIAYAGVLEISQNFSPGRTPAILDFAAGALGVCASALAVKFWYTRRTVPLAS
jgi:VanZ family protein